MDLNRIYTSITYRLSKLKSKIISLRGIKIGAGTIIEPGAEIRRQYGGNITIGKNCYVSRGAQLLTHGGDINIGDNCTINPMCVIYGQGGVQILDNVRIAAHCVIVPSNHIFCDTSTPIYLQGLSKKGILINSDVWLGAGVKVLDGVTIGEGCVIGANSVVTKSTEPYGVYVGIPAKKIKSRK